MIQSETESISNTRDILVYNENMDIEQLKGLIDEARERLEYLLFGPQTYTLVCRNENGRKGCGKPFTSNSPHTLYCPDCKRKINTEKVRKRRANRKKEKQRTSVTRGITVER